MPFSHVYQLQHSLSQLREGLIDDGEFYQRIARTIANAAKSSRAGVWLLRARSDGESMVCMGMYDRVRGRSTKVPAVASSQAKPFFDALEGAGFVVANDAAHHPTTRLLFERRITRLNVRSLAAMAISVNGKLYGAFTCTQTDEFRMWTQKEILLLKRLGANASLVVTEADTWLKSQTGGLDSPFT